MERQRPAKERQCVTPNGILALKKNTNAIYQRDFLVDMRFIKLGRNLFKSARYDKSIEKDAIVYMCGFSRLGRRRMVVDKRIAN